MAVQLDGFRLVEDDTRPDGRARKMLFEHEDGRINLSAVMKPAEPDIGAALYRDDRWNYLQSVPPAEEKGRLWTEGDRAFFEYFTEVPFQGVPLHQKHVHTFLIHEGSRIEIHVSITSFKENDQKWLDAFQRSIQPIPAAGLKSNFRLNPPVGPPAG